MNRKFIARIKKGVRNPGQAAGYVLKRGYRDTSVRVTSNVSVGSHVLEREWDVLILLDTCRVDALRDVSPEYDFIQNVEYTLSVGGSSPEWMVHTFDERWTETLQKTAYLTSNAWAERVLDERLHPDEAYADFEILTRLTRCGEWDIIRPKDLGRMERVWKFVPEDDRSESYQEPHGLMPGGAPPRYVTDRSVSVARNSDYDRMILHYMQPHAPYVANATAEGRELHDYEKNPFDYLRNGGSRDTVWRAYLDELRYVLDDLELLLQNLDAETVVVSADHGEAFGEFTVYNHHTGSLHPKIRLVPWVVTSATDTQSYSPETEPRERDGIDVDDALRALGYR